VATWFITAAICTSVIFLLLILDDAQLLFAFVAISVAQRSKVLVRGPCDIPTAASMQLDYSYVVPKEP
jgi:hypothetical protein